MKPLSLCLALALAAFGARAADDKPAEKPNRLDRAGHSAAKSIERTGDRAAKATGRGVNAAGKAVGHTVEKTEDWIKKKTQ